MSEGSRQNRSGEIECFVCCFGNIIGIEFGRDVIFNNILRRRVLFILVSSSTSITSTFVFGPDGSYYASELLNWMFLHDARKQKNKMIFCYV